MRRTAAPTSRSTPKRRGGDELKDFGGRIRELREKRGLTQQDLAVAIGVTLGLIGRYERGEHLPTADRLLSLSKVLRASADFLLRGDRTAEPEKIPFKNVRLFERFRVIDELPKDAQETVFRLLDAVIDQNEFERFAEQRKVKRTA